MTRTDEQVNALIAKARGWYEGLDGCWRDSGKNKIPDPTADHATAAECCEWAAREKGISVAVWTIGGWTWDAQSDWYDAEGESGCASLGDMESQPQAQMHALAVALVAMGIVEEE